MGLGDFAEKFILSIWPPKDGENPHRWRKAVFTTLVIISGVLTIHIAEVKGYLEPMGIHAHATKDEVHQIDLKTNAILYAIYAPQVRSKVRERCDAPDAERREHVNKELDRILKDYRDATGQDYKPVPRCDEV